MDEDRYDDGATNLAVAATSKQQHEENITDLVGDDMAAGVEEDGEGYEEEEEEGEHSRLNLMTSEVKQS